MLIQSGCPLDSFVANLDGAADFCNKMCHKQTYRYSIWGTEKCQYPR